MTDQTNPAGEHETADDELIRALRHELHEQIVAYDAERADAMVAAATRRAPSGSRTYAAPLAAAAAVLLVGGGAALVAGTSHDDTPTAAGGPSPAPASTSAAASSTTDAPASSIQLCLARGNKCKGLEIPDLKDACARAADSGHPRATIVRRLGDNRQFTLTAHCRSKIKFYSIGVAVTTKASHGPRSPGSSSSEPARRSSTAGTSPSTGHPPVSTGPTPTTPASSTN